MSLRVLLVDDHAMFREALRMSLEMEAGLVVVGEAADAVSALQSAAQCLPDIVCMDVNLPGMDGIAATRALLAQNPRLTVIGLSAHDDPHLISRLREAGAAAYVNKMDAGRQLPQLIRSMAGGLPPGSAVPRPPVP
jgi:DNA-binding NarL/FixJ family response regulator